jgi:predicted nucleic acid-binding protein
MILVDSSVWIDYFRGVVSPTTDKLDDLLDRGSALIGDLMITEVLQGCVSDKDFEQLQTLLDPVGRVEIGGGAVAIEAALNFRRLRALGITPRKTIDTLIATRSILDKLPLLFSDRDFQPFVTHLGLVDAMALSGDD